MFSIKTCAFTHARVIEAQNIASLGMYVTVAPGCCVFLSGSTVRKAESNLSCSRPPSRAVGEPLPIFTQTVGRVSRQSWLLGFGCSPDHCRLTPLQSLQDMNNARRIDSHDASDESTLVLFMIYRDIPFPGRRRRALFNYARLRRRRA